MSDDRDHDVVFLHSPTEDGDGVRVVRARAGNVEIGEVRPMTDGKPLRGEIVSLRPREGSPRVCDVKVEYTHTAKEDDKAATGDVANAKGPAQVASARYRDNWEAIFGALDAAPKLLQAKKPRKAPSMN